MIKNVDVVFGLSWGDEGKGKVSAALAKSGKYNMVARWAGGNNAGHTVVIDGKKYKTHLIPSGVFYGIKSHIGPGCVLHPESFFNEISYLKENGFDTSLITVDPNTHIVTDSHISEDKKDLAQKLGTTSKGIAPAYRDKMARIGIRAKEIHELYNFVCRPDFFTKEEEYNILCEGAQGYWLDINQGNYPFVTSSDTLPFAAASIGFPAKFIKNIYGICKAYDTRSGEDPLFPDSLLEDPELSKIAKLGAEFGVTTGRPRKVNWLNLDKLLEAVKVSGTTHVIINKCDILNELSLFKIIYKDQIKEFDNLKSFSNFLKSKINSDSDYNLVKDITFSSSPEFI